MVPYSNYWGGGLLCLSHHYSLPHGFLDLLTALFWTCVFVTQRVGHLLLGQQRGATYVAVKLMVISWYMHRSQKVSIRCLRILKRPKVCKFEVPIGRNKEYWSNKSLLFAILQKNFDRFLYTTVHWNLNLRNISNCKLQIH